MPYDCESDAANIQDNLNCVHTGSVVVFLPEVDSTHNLIKAYLANGADEGLVAVADSQTGGRGRMGRIWHSPPETGVYLSVLLKPPVGPNHLALFTLLAGVTAVQTVNEFCLHPASLKWPNDILINGKKVCGLLCELVQNQGEPSGLIIGVGINVNHLPDQFPEDLKNIATSLRIVNNSLTDRLAVIRSFLMNLDREYQTYLKEGPRPIIEKWSRHTDLFGKKVSVTRGPNVIIGTATGLDKSGRLVLFRDNGQEEAFDSGEVSLRTS